MYLTKNLQQNKIVACIRISRKMHFPPFAKWFRPVLHSPKMRGTLIIISRLRLGHSGLNSTMHVIGKHPTGLCDWCGIRETVEHVLIKCNRYSEERAKLIEEFKKKGVQQLTLKKLLDLEEGDSLLI